METNFISYFNLLGMYTQFQFHPLNYVQYVPYIPPVLTVDIQQNVITEKKPIAHKRITKKSTNPTIIAKIRSTKNGERYKVQQKKKKLISRVQSIKSYDSRKNSTDESLSLPSNKSQIKLSNDLIFKSESYRLTMEVHKEKTALERIAANQKVYSEVFTEFNDKTKKLNIFKKLSTKIFNVTIPKPLNPYENIRICDWVFRLDTNCLNNLPSDDIKYDWCIYESFCEIKRCTQMICDTKLQTYTWFYEDRYALQQIVNTSALEYFTDWLLSIGDYRAKEFLLVVDKFVKSIDLDTALATIGSLGFGEVEDGDDISLLNSEGGSMILTEKKYYKKLSQTTWD